MNKLFLYCLYSLLLLTSCVFEDKNNAYQPLVDPLPTTCLGKNFSVLLPNMYVDLLGQTSRDEFVLAGKHLLVLDSIGQPIQEKEVNALASTSSTLGGYWMITTENMLIRINESLNQQLRIELHYANLDKAVISMATTEDGGVIILAYESSTGKGFIQKRDYMGLLQWHKDPGYYFFNSQILALSTGTSYVVVHYDRTNYNHIVTKLDENGLEVGQFIIPLIPPDHSSHPEEIKPTQDGGIILTTMRNVYKVSASLEMEWRVTNCCNANTLNQTLDGDYILAGVVAEKIMIEKINRDGIIIWSKSIDNFVLPEIFSIHSTQDGGYLILLTVVNQYNGTDTKRWVDTSKKTGYALNVDQAGNYCQ